MVRINLINPNKLSDQHLIAEYNEILMLVAYIKKYPCVDDIPFAYCLGKGHMKFFKDKLVYIKKRHDALIKEMNKRGFKTNKKISLNSFSTKNKKDWRPCKKDYDIIKKRIVEKLKLKPKYYRYYGKIKSQQFFIENIKNAKEV